MKPRRKVLEFVREQAVNRTPDQLSRELREAMEIVYTDYRRDHYGVWFKDTVCPTCGANMGSWERKCRDGGHRGKAILRREYTALNAQQREGTE